MTARVWSVAALGAEAFMVRVEADLAGGLPRFAVVGLADAAVREARDRVAAALRNAGYSLPPGKLTIGLAPAELKKEGSHLDLPMALAALAVTGQLVLEPWAEDMAALGELALDGTILPVPGALTLCARARAAGKTRALVAPGNAAEAAAAGLAPLAAATLAAAAETLCGPEPAAAPPPSSPAAAGGSASPDLCEVRGQLLARRALEVSAAGGHNLLMVGPPGTGKSMLASRLPGLLPPLSGAEALEVTALHAAAGLCEGGLMTRRPFRAPHSSARPAALLGGGPKGRPGELALAHNGVLFLDELPEFPRDSLECLRQPLEDRVVRLSRARRFLEFPADCAVAAAMNPCPCGWAGARVRACRCPHGAPERYRGRISGPLLDRLDLHVELSPLPFAQWAGTDGPAPEGSAAVRGRVERARRRALARAGTLNARLTPGQVRVLADPEDAARALLARAADSGTLSPRALDRVLRVALTVADLAGALRPAKEHVAEALRYRAPGGGREGLWSN